MQTKFYFQVKKKKKNNNKIMMKVMIMSKNSIKIMAMKMSLKKMIKVNKNLKKLNMKAEQQAKLQKIFYCPQTKIIAISITQELLMLATSILD